MCHVSHFSLNPARSQHKHLRSFPIFHTQKLTGNFQMRRGKRRRRCQRATRSPHRCRHWCARRCLAHGFHGINRSLHLGPMESIFQRELFMVVANMSRIFVPGLFNFCNTFARIKITFLTHHAVNMKEWHISIAEIRLCFFSQNRICFKSFPPTNVCDVETHGFGFGGTSNRFWYSRKHVGWWWTCSDGFTGSHSWSIA